MKQNEKRTAENYTVIDGDMSALGKQKGGQGMTLTKEDIMVIGELFDQKMDEKLQPIYERMGRIEERIDRIEERLDALEERVHNMELSIENVTNHNIQLLAENHMELVNKLNRSIPVHDKSTILEVQISGCLSRLEHLEREIEALKAQGI